MKSVRSALMASAGAALFGLLSGCAGFQEKVHGTEDLSTDKWVSGPLMPPLTAPVDLVSLLTDGKDASDGSAAFAPQFERAVSFFNRFSQETLVLRRNLLQDRLKVSADQLCDQYKANIMRKQSRSNFWLGTASLFLGSAGALAKSADAARALSGGAALATGVRSEYNQDYFLDQTAAVITKAIDQRQAEIIGLAQVKRQAQITDYSMIQAIDDISRYHAACSLAGALSLTEKAVQIYDPSKSVDDAVKVMNKLRDAQNK